MRYLEANSMSKPSVRVHRPDGIIGVEKTMAIHTVEKYCADNGLSVDKLRGLIFDISDNVAMFMAPSEIKPDGLLNDIASQPRPVLTIEDMNGNIHIRQTEYTSKYIAM